MKAVPALASLTVIVLGTPAIALASTVGSHPASFGQKNICAERSVVHPSVNGSRVPPLSSAQTALVWVYSCPASMPFSRPGQCVLR